jgi:hypothetical protein
LQIGPQPPLILQDGYARREENKKKREEKKEEKTFLATCEHSDPHERNVRKQN